MTEEQFRQAAAMANLKPPDAPFDLERMKRAKFLAGRVMQVMQHYCRRPMEARDALVASAYIANATLSVDEVLD